MYTVGLKIKKYVLFAIVISAAALVLHLYTDRQKVYDGTFVFNQTQEVQYGYLC